MITKAQIEEIVEQFLDAESEFLVEVSVSSANRIAVTIDGIQGIPIKRCIEVSRHIESHFDRDVEDFELEVSSAGLTSPFVLVRQYHKNVGRMVDVVLKTGESFQGKLTAATDTHFSISYQQKVPVEGTKKKQIHDIVREFEYSEVKSTMQVISFR